DDPRAVETFGQEVGPALRELVEAERSASTAGGAGAPAPGVTTVPPGITSTRPGSSTVPAGIAPTPDDGTRLTGELAWDEDSRPSAPAPEGEPAAYPAERLALPQHLIDIHDHLRGELASVRDVV